MAKAKKKKKKIKLHRVYAEEVFVSVTWKKAQFSKLYLIFIRSPTYPCSLALKSKHPERVKKKQTRKEGKHDVTAVLSFSQFSNHLMERKHPRMLFGSRCQQKCTD